MTPTTIITIGAMMLMVIVLLLLLKCCLCVYDMLGIINTKIDNMEKDIAKIKINMIFGKVNSYERL